MPLYEYRCTDCQERLEVLQPVGAGARGLTCPACGGSRLEKLLSSFSAVGDSKGVGGDATCKVPGCGTGFT